MAQPGSPPRRLSRRAEDDQYADERARRSRRTERPARPARPGWQNDAFSAEDTDTDLPPWAGPSGFSVRTGGRRRAAPPDPYAGGYAGVAAPADEGYDRGPELPEPEPAGSRMAARRRGRAAATRLRKSRRKVYRWSAIGIVVCVVGAVIAAIATSVSSQPAPYVTTLQHGEFKSVPSACRSVSAAVLTRYLPGSGRTTTNQFSAATQSQCSFTIDAKPVFRLLQVSAQAYQPFAAASGNGSASANAQDNLILTRAGLAQPPKKSPLSPAVITPLHKLGRRAFAAYQQEKAAGIVSDMVTVVVLERNVLITVQLSAQESPGFAPTPTATLQAGATAAAEDVLAKLRTQPTA